MTLLLIPFFFLCCFLYFFKGKRSQILDWREAFLGTAVILAALMVLSVEALSFFHILTVNFVRILWAMVAMIGGTLCWRSIDWKALKESKFSWPKYSAFDLSLFIMIAGILCLTAVVAFWAPPNTNDSMTYHMPRVMHWVQNHTVGFYPTSILRQLNYAPGAEFLITHVYLLSGDDRWLNFVQWFSMVGSLIGVSLIAKYFGAGLRGQLLSAVVAATIPMGILQSNSTQTDYVVTLWVVCTAAWVLKSFVRPGARDFIFAAISMGLAVLTKGTAFVALPFVVWGIVAGWRKFSWKFPVAIIVAILILNAGYWSRNMSGQSDHSPFPVIDRLTMESVAPQKLMANTVRNIAVHFAMPHDAWNAFFRGIVDGTFRLLKVDPNDLTITSGGASSLLAEDYVFNEDIAGNFFHFLLILFFVTTVFSRQGYSFGRRYVIAVGVGAIMLVVLVKWQPWISRFQLPLFVLSAPIIGAGLERFRRMIQGVVISVLVVSALGILFVHPVRPMIGRGNIFNTPRTLWYFSYDRGMWKSYAEIVEGIKNTGCRNIGLQLSSSACEYPFWAIANNNSLPVRLEAVLGKSESFNIKYPLGDFEPCAIIKEDPSAPQSLVYKGKPFFKPYQYKYYAMYLRLDHMPAEFQRELMQGFLQRSEASK